MIYFFTALVILDTAHVLSPMVMAWSRGDFRAVMLRHWPRYILVPVGALAISLATASQSYAVVDALVTIYFAWNVWHFASQNYGLLRLLQMRRARRVKFSAHTGWASFLTSRPFVMAVTIVGMVVWPVLANDPWHWRLINLAIFAIPHWVSEIFLTSWASTRWKIFAPLILAAGCVGLIWVTPRATGMPVVGALWVCWRTGLGFVHFIYDGLLWRFGNPEVRATIGKGLFELPSGKTSTHARYECGVVSTGKTRCVMDRW
jgi:hypothetical protein